MALTSFPGNWSPNDNLTGNAQIVVDGTTLWVVGNSTTSTGDPTPHAGAAIYKSVDNGATFQWVVDVPGVVVTAGMAFDPAACIDTSHVLHFVGQTRTGSTIYLQKYSYDTVGAVMTGPTQFTSGSAIPADYDIVVLANGHTYVVTSTLVAPSGVSTGLDSLQGFELAANGSLVGSVENLITPQAFTAGNRYSAVSLVVVGTSVEVYIQYHPKLVTFQNYALTFAMTIRSAPNTFGAFTTLHTTMARHTDNRLTVVSNGTSRVLWECFYTQQYSSLIANVVVGYLPTIEDPWAFHEFIGTPTASYSEPLLCQTADSLVLAYIEQDYSLHPQVDRPIRVCDLNPSTFELTPRGDFEAVVTATFLRGAKTPLPTQDIWCFLAQRVADGSAKFFSGYTTPPVVSISPAGPITAVRDVPIMLDASATYNAQMDPMSFTWSLSGGSGSEVLTPQFNKATLLVPASFGPGIEGLIVGLSVENQTSSGAAIPPAVTSMVVVNVPAVPPASIEPSPPIEAARNTTITVTPTVIPGSSYPLTYTWVQAGGSTVLIEWNPQGSALIVGTAGAALVGESLVFQLSVMDGINDPVTAFFTVVVAARVLPGEPYTLTNANGVLTKGISGWAIESTALTWSNFAISPTTPLPSDAVVVGIYPVIVGSWPVNSGRLSLWVSAWPGNGIAPGTWPIGGQQLFEPTLGSTSTESYLIGGLNGIGFGGTDPSALSGFGICVDLVQSLIQDYTPVDELDITAVGFAIYYTSATPQTGVAPIPPPFTVPEGQWVAWAVPSICTPYAGFGTAIGFPATYAPVAQASLVRSNRLVTGLAGIVYRNTSVGAVWSSPVAEPVQLGFTGFKRSTLLNGDEIACYIAPYVVNLLGTSNDGTFNYSEQVYPPNVATTVLDAALVETGAVAMLTSDQQLYVFPTINLTTDDAKANIDLSSYGTFSRLYATVSYGGSRVLAVSGPSGCLLLLVRSDWSLQRSIFLSVESGLLYGADNVQWVQLSEVESLQTGQVFVGTVDSLGNCYETLISLTQRRVIATLDASELLKQQVATTGDVLFEVGDPYSGAPSAPVLSAPVPVTGGLAISWTLARPDLASGYNLQSSQDGVNYAPFLMVRLGQITTTTVAAPGRQTWYQVQVTSLDGNSPWSNAVVYTP